MATLTLTDEEEAANSFLSFDDESLGRLVKRAALKIAADADGKQATIAMASALMLVDMAHCANAETLTLTLENAIYEGEGIGDWKLTLKRTKKTTPKGTR